MFLTVEKYQGDILNKGSQGGYYINQWYQDYQYDLGHIGTFVFLLSVAPKHNR